MTEDKTKAMDPSAIFTNRITVTRSTIGTRISFAEVFDGDVRYRVGVMMPDASGMALRDLLNQLFPPPEQQN